MNEFVESKWSLGRLTSMIENEVEENLHLDYKSASSLSRADKKRDEISKDVSSFANSDGGVLIYGISEFQQRDRAHLPECLDPILDPTITKEWLEQIITARIQPRVEGIVIYPVRNMESTYFVVEIPRSVTAHQASDKRYYKRFNFKSEPMEDYEVRDVMSRGKSAMVRPEFWIELEQSKARQNSIIMQRKPTSVIHLRMALRNVGLVRAMHVHVRMQLSGNAMHKSSTAADIKNVRNLRRDVLEVRMGIPFYGSSWYEPIMPGDKHLVVEKYRLVNSRSRWDGANIEYQIFVDDTRPYNGSTMLSEINVIQIEGSC